MMAHREQDIRNWAALRGISTQSSAIGQMKKLGEEFSELNEALHINDHGAVKDAIGDMVVVLTIIAAFNRLTVYDCIEAAWRQIKDRKGKMENGVFVKEDPA